MRSAYDLKKFNEQYLTQMDYIAFDIFRMTYPETQWAAVKMCRLEMIEPPQYGPSNPGSSMSVLLAFIKAATHGQLAMFDFAPFVILFWNTKEGDTGELPHSWEKKISKCLPLR